MRFISKFIKSFLFKDYERFAKKLGFESWDQVCDHTFGVFQIPPDASYSATRLPSGEWAVWSDEGQLPYSFLKFKTWYEAIQYLRETFEKNQYPEECWEPQGFHPGDDVFQSLPDMKKVLD